MATNHHLTYDWKPGMRHQVTMLPATRTWWCKDCAQQFDTWPADDQACPGPAGPPDLDQAIQAAKFLARRLRVAATLTLMQNEGWAKVFTDAADALEQLQTTRDRQADLEVYAAQLYDLLEQVWTMTDGDLWHTQPFGITVRTALDLGAAHQETDG